MKTAHKLLLLLSIFCSSILPKEFDLTPKNTVLISDLDEVLIEKSLFLGGVAQLRHLTGEYTKDTDGKRETLRNKQGNSIGGLTFHLLYHGMRKPYLTPHVGWMIKTLEKSRCFIDGTEKIYRYLKDKKGYTIVYATNKDRISYDIAAQALGDKFTSLAGTVFVAHPGSSPQVIAQLHIFADLLTTPASYKELLHKTLTVQPTAHILHAPGKKPDREYYEYVEENLGPDKNMIFIDDKPSNIRGFDALQTTSSAQRIGIIFQNPQQLAQEFVNLGILSEIEDAALLEDIRYPGIWGKIKLAGKKLMAKLTPAAA
ncbi:MAG TPA: hypothetical protein VJ201_07410 [Candidatus Babeliales bacterium]|nr:hypothetical protein [Candidatus Babeliales bacterium]HLC07331.1 hypothetical protein [Candidatus Babeliales bacterium]